MKTTVTLLLTIVMALAVHLTLGWAWTLGAGVLGGALAARRGWLVGALGVGLSWTVLVVYSAVAAPEPFAILLDTLGGILGNTPGALAVALTLLIGVLLGALGGIIGSQLGALTAGPSAAS